MPSALAMRQWVGVLPSRQRFLRPSESAMTEKISVGVSSCLLGEAVRYNGGQKRSRYCTDELTRYFNFVPFCPEVAIGMGVPREPIRLQGDFDSPRALGTINSALDVTDKLTAYANAVAGQSSRLGGFIFMDGSPSCGLYSTKIYSHDQVVYPARRAGVFAQRLRERLPWMPLEEAARLNDPLFCENFIARVFMFADWRKSVACAPSAPRLMAFHSRQRYFAMAYSPALYPALARLMASVGHGDIREKAHAYIRIFMSKTATPPRPKAHARVLFHIFGELKNAAPRALRQELVDAIERYRKDEVPLAIPVALVRHCAATYASDDIRYQSYLNPYPDELGLRNKIQFGRT